MQSSEPLTVSTSGLLVPVWRVRQLPCMTIAKSTVLDVRLHAGGEPFAPWCGSCGLASILDSGAM